MRLARPTRRKKVSANGKAPARGLVISIPRLFLYHRGLEDAMRDGDTVVTSQELAARIGRGVSSTQIRKDLSYLGNLGRRGKGYDVAILVNTLGRILGLDRHWRIAIVGFGNLGRALAGFLEFREEKFHIAAIFDADRSLVGSQWHNVTIQHIDDLPATLPSLQCSIGIVAVPASQAQNVAEKLVAAGTRALLNFAPTRLVLNSGVAIRSVDLASEMSILTHSLA